MHRIALHCIASHRIASRRIALHCSRAAAAPAQQQRTPSRKKGVSAPPPHLTAPQPPPHNPPHRYRVGLKGFEGGGFKGARPLPARAADEGAALLPAPRPLGFEWGGFGVDLGFFGVRLSPTSPPIALSFRCLLMAEQSSSAPKLVKAERLQSPPSSILWGPTCFQLGGGYLITPNSP